MANEEMIIKAMGNMFNSIVEVLKLINFNIINSMQKIENSIIEVNKTLIQIKNEGIRNL